MPSARNPESPIAEVPIEQNKLSTEPAAAPEFDKPEAKVESPVIEKPENNLTQNRGKPIDAESGQNSPPDSSPARDELNWSQTAFELNLKAIARQIVLNTVVNSYTDNTLKLGFLPELEVMLKPEIEKQIKKAVEQQLGVSLKLEFISMSALDVETPHQAEVRRLEQERQAVIQQIHQDGMVQQLKSVFGAELIEQSVRKRNTESK